MAETKTNQEYIEELGLDVGLVLKAVIATCEFHHLDFDSMDADVKVVMFDLVLTGARMRRKAEELGR